jgi:hypothetical protein
MRVAFDRSGGADAVATSRPDLLTLTSVLSLRERKSSADIDLTFSFPSSSLGTHLSPKLCFAPLEWASNFIDLLSLKQGFGRHAVPKLELGNEGVLLLLDHDYKREKSGPWLGTEPAK